LFSNPKGFFNSYAPTEYSHAHTMLSLLSFSTLRPLSDFILLSSPIDGECNALLAIPLLRQPLAEPYQGVEQPYEDPSMDSSFRITELKEFSFLLSAHLLNALLAEYLFIEHPAVLSSVHSLHLLNAHLADLHKILSDSGSL
jgi:hypothetical protein